MGPAAAGRARYLGGGARSNDKIAGGERLCVLATCCCVCVSVFGSLRVRVLAVLGVHKNHTDSRHDRLRELQYATRGRQRHNRIYSARGDVTRAASPHPFASILGSQMNDATMTPNACSRQSGPRHSSENTLSSILPNCSTA
jgi:hypothetical protein